MGEIKRLNVISGEQRGDDLGSFCFKEFDDSDETLYYHVATTSESGLVQNMLLSDEDAKKLANMRKKVVTITYKNWEGITAKRNIIPIKLEYKKSEWHAHEEWILEAYDLDKKGHREFAVNNILVWDDKQVKDEKKAPHISDIVIIANAFFAKHAIFQSFDDLREFKGVIYRNIINGYANSVRFDNALSSYANVIYIEDAIFLKEEKGIRLLDIEIDEELINKVNSIYPEELQDILKKSRDIYKGQTKKLTDKK
ncbi:MAG: hypothetical protein J5892_02400 [Bacilli bacterium]|nr:hypothetical protein [Bacilli bacterium]